MTSVVALQGMHPQLDDNSSLQLKVSTSTERLTDLAHEYLLAHLVDEFNLLVLQTSMLHVVVDLQDVRLLDKLREELVNCSAVVLCLEYVRHGMKLALHEQGTVPFERAFTSNALPAVFFDDTLTLSMTASHLKRIMAFA